MATPRVTKDIRNLELLIQKEPEKVATWLDGFAEEIVTNIKLSMGTSPPGVEYTRGGVTHVASQPGHPPNPDIDDLRSSIKWERDGEHKRVISDGVEHGIMMEDGTEHVAPRPFMKPEFDAAQQRIEQDAKDKLGLENI